VSLEEHLVHLPMGLLLTGLFFSHVSYSLHPQMFVVL
jgi:hypothetical protein